MFLSIDKEATQSILLTANDGRGTLEEVRIVFTHLTSNRTIELVKQNQSTKRNRYDEFTIEPEDLADMEEGDFLYQVYATDSEDNEGFDPDENLETGRGRVQTTFVTTEVIHERTSQEVIYERN